MGFVQGGVFCALNRHIRVLFCPFAKWKHKEKRRRINTIGNHYLSKWEVHTGIICYQTWYLSNKDWSYGNMRTTTRNFMFCRAVGCSALVRQRVVLQESLTGRQRFVTMALSKNSFHFDVRYLIGLHAGGVSPSWILMIQWHTVGCPWWLPSFGQIWRRNDILPCW